MDNATALHEFERSLRRRFPDRSTPAHYVSDVRQFQRVCPKAWAEVTRADVERINWPWRGGSVCRLDQYNPTHDSAHRAVPVADPAAAGCAHGIIATRRADCRAGRCNQRH